MVLKKKHSFIEEWKNDCKIDNTKLEESASLTPVLHSKYWVIYLHQSKKYNSLLAEYKKLSLLKSKYYSGRLSKEECENLGWDINYLKILKTELKSYVESDDDVIKLTTEIENQKQIIKYLEDILKMIHNRSFLIKNIIDWIKFKDGQ